MSNEDVGFIIPSDPESRKRLKSCVEEASGALQFIDDKRQFIKDIGDNVTEEWEIPKAAFNRMVRIHHKQNYEKSVQEETVFQTLYETVFGSAVEDPS